MYILSAVAYCVAFCCFVFGAHYIGEAVAGSVKSIAGLATGGGLIFIGFVVTGVAVRIFQGG